MSSVAKPAMLRAHLVYLLGWLSFGALHSLLAAEGVKRRLAPRLGGFHRLTYNLVALVHIALVLAIGRAVLGAAPLYALPATMRGMMAVLAAAGIYVMIVALRGYDLGRFSGLAQFRAARTGRDEPEDEPLRLGGLHRYVRHPLYLGGLMVLWGMAGATAGPFALATAAWGTLYLVIGARFEERKLLRLYGRAYADYRARVPAFLPWRGRAL